MIDKVQNIKAIMNELIPDALKGVLAVATPYFLWLLEFLPTGFAVIGGFFGTLHIINKWRLTNIELEKAKKDGNKSL
tara:strand:+ start:346 stop:576 length:231 start_codon:yes stop_codon:yes gene_type:complete